MLLRDMDIIPKKSVNRAESGKQKMIMVGVVSVFYNSHIKRTQSLNQAEV